MAGIRPAGPRMMSGGGLGRLRIQSRQFGMATLASTLGPMITQALGADSADLSIPKARVADRATAAKLGGFPSPSTPSDPAGLPTVFQAIESLGLKLEGVNDIPLEVVVVDHVEKVPDGN